jgi:AsmA protein
VTAGEEKPVAAQPDSGQAAFTMPEFYIGGIDIQDANITWRDNQAKTSTRIEYFNLETGAIRPGSQTSFEAQFAFRNEDPKVIAGVEFNGDMGFDTAMQRYSLSDFRMNLKASGSVVPGNEQQIDLVMSELLADLEKQTLDIDSLKLKTKELEANIKKLVATDLLADSISIKGDVDLQIPSIRTLLNRIGEPAPATADKTVLAELAMSSQFQAGIDALEFRNLQARVDDSTLTGNVAVHTFDAPVYRFNLALDQIDIDRYLPPSAIDASGSEPNVAITIPATSVEEELPIPVDLLRELNATGQLRVGAIKVMNLRLADIKTTLNAGSGKVELKPLTAALYDGRFNGDILLNVSGEQPVYLIGLQLENLQSGPLLEDYAGKRLLEGKMNVQGKLDTRGMRISELEKNLNGTVDLAFKDGALSTDTRQRLQERKAELKQKLSGEQTTRTTGPVGEPTKFSSITAKATIVNGEVSNDDLDVRARHMYVTGKGKFEIPSNYIDYVLTVLLSNDGAGQDDPLDELVDFPIEYHLKGKLEELDYGRITRNALANAVKAKLRYGVDQEKQAVQAELESKKTAAKAELEQQKRAAAAKEKAELEKKKKEAERQAQEKLDKKKEKLLDRLLN